MKILDDLSEKYSSVYEKYEKDTELLRQDEFNLSSINKENIKKMPKIIYFMVLFVVLVFFVMAFSLFI